MSKLREAALALIDRWDSPVWRDLPYTALFIEDLRTALAEEPEPEPVAQVGLFGGDR